MQDDSIEADGVGFIRAFARTVAEYPDRIAIASARRPVTYRQLDAWSDGIARTLLATVGRGSEPVMGLTENDEAAAAVFVAVAKVGRPSVLLDATTPPARMASICESAAPAATLFVPALASVARAIGDVAGTTIEVPDVDRVAPGAAGIETEDDPERPLSIIFTSGSTGRPKGVTIG